MNAREQVINFLQSRMQMKEAQIDKARAEYDELQKAKIEIESIFHRAEKDAPAE